MPDAAQKPKTYIIAGDDYNGAFTQANATYANDPNCEIIRAKPGQSIEDAIIAKNIKGPANIIIDCHGGEDGTVTWNKGEPPVKYEQILGALPRQGVESVTISSCYGGSVQKKAILEAAPEGTIVQSQVGAHNVGDGRFIAEFAKTAHKGGNSTDLMVESLADFKPAQYEKDAASWNAEKKYGVLDGNAENALPHILGIGGKPPVALDLDIEMQRLAHRDASFNAAAMNGALKEVHEKFSQADHTVAEINADNARIEAVAKKLEAGGVPEGAEEKRAAYALTAAYLEKSGELAHRVAVAKNHGHEPVELSPPQKAQPDPPKTELPQQRPREPINQEPIPQNMPDLTSLKTEVFGKHHLVTGEKARQTNAQTHALEEFAKIMKIQGVRTDAPQLNDAEIQKIQAALHVKQDGLIGEKTLGAMMHAEEIRALPTPDKGVAPASKGQMH